MDSGKDRPRPRPQPQRHPGVPPRASRGRYREDARQQDDTYYEYYEEEDDYDEYPEEEYRRQLPPARSRQPVKRPRRKRRVWPILLTGCGLGTLITVVVAAVIVFLALHSLSGGRIGGLPVLNSMTSFTRAETQTIPLSTINQLHVCDKIGNLSITVDPTASNITVNAKKIVQASGQGDADQKFKQMIVEIQPPGTITQRLSCARPAVTPTPTTAPAGGTTESPASTPANSLTVNVTIPNSSGLLANTSNAVDIAITLPPSALPKTGPTMQVNVEAPYGKVTVDGLSGMLNIRGGTGDVTVTHAILTDGSSIETGQGNLTFDGRLLPAPNHQAIFKLLCERGDIDATLPPDTMSTVDVVTNVGTIKSDFDIKINKDNEQVGYHGPLVPGTETRSTGALLSVHVSTGNITLHKGQS
ncbi:MAG: hypothetical protein IMW89_04625 [Ktedonobacteraceae bacterium]|nr:hypothetical protein [Ktedonobacteraceae bacterium]